MMAWAASKAPSGLRASFSIPMPFSMGARSMGWPITPVEAMITSRGSMPRASPTI